MSKGSCQFSCARVRKLVCDLEIMAPRHRVHQDGATLERDGMRWNRMRFHLIPSARTGDPAPGDEAICYRNLAVFSLRPKR